MLKLYYASDTCSLASIIALEDAGAEYETVKVDFAAKQQLAPDYLEINARARVPALITEHGILTETPAILAYVAQRFPDAGIAPLDDPFAFAQAQEFNSYICATLHVAHAHRMRGYRWAGRSRHHRGDAAQGTRSGHRLLRADRAGHAARSLGPGRYLFDLRRLSLHRVAMA